MFVQGWRESVNFSHWQLKMESADPRRPQCDWRDLFIYLALDCANGRETWLCHKSAPLPSSVRMNKLASVKVRYFNLPQLMLYILRWRFVPEYPPSVGVDPHDSTHGCLNGHVQVGVIAVSVSVPADPRCSSLAPRLPLRAAVCMKTIWPAFLFLPT